MGDGPARNDEPGVRAGFAEAEGATAEPRNDADAAGGNTQEEEAPAPGREARSGGERKEEELAATREDETEEGRKAKEEAEREAELARPSVRIELEELDEALDANFFAPVPESSEVLLQRAIDGANKKWWLRAADGNVPTAEELWATADRKDLLQVNWRNPEAHHRTALMACALRGQERTMRGLIKPKKARVNGFDDNGCTALNLAARGGCKLPRRKCLIRLLLHKIC